MNIPYFTTVYESNTKFINTTNAIAIFTGKLPLLGENILIHSGEFNSENSLKKNYTTSRWRILVLRSHDQLLRKRANKILSFCRLVTSFRAFYGLGEKFVTKFWKRMAGVLHEMGRLYSSNCKYMGRGVEDKQREVSL